MEDEWNPLHASDWWPLLEQELGGRSLWALLGFVRIGADGVLPVPDDVFRALQLTACRDTKVIIVGQDPYDRPGLADGLCFSVREDVKVLPPSLRTIFRELQANGFECADKGSLEPWARQGVLLMNTALTVEQNDPGSHARRWEEFTNAVIRIVVRRRDPVSLLWGRFAQRKEALIKESGGSSRRILKSSHPAPPACYGPCGGSPAFVGSQPFRRTNELLGGDGIDWDLLA
jgi:uracil-DNA glycosylase